MGLEAFRSRDGRGQLDTEQLRTRQSELELATSQTVGGVPKERGFIVSAATGIIDLILRPNFAIAGAAEELFSPQGGGAGAVPGRVFSELFSGIGGLKGQKEGFGDVLKQSGVGELGRADIPLPFTDKTLPITGRGVLGLGLDIITDPITYVTLGQSAVGRQAVRAAVKQGAKQQGAEFVLSPFGKKVLREAVTDVRP